MLINFEIPCWKFWVEVEDDKKIILVLFGENYSLVPEIWKNYSLVPGMKFEILDRIEDELWTKFQYSCEFKRSSI